MDILDRIKKIRKRHEAEYQALSKLAGMSIEELDADLTAPDPNIEEKNSHD